MNRTEKTSNPEPSFSITTEKTPNQSRALTQSFERILHDCKHQHGIKPNPKLNFDSKLMTRLIHKRSKKRCFDQLRLSPAPVFSFTVADGYLQLLPSSSTQRQLCLSRRILQGQLRMEQGPDSDGNVAFTQYGFGPNLGIALSIITGSNLTLSFCFRQTRSKPTERKRGQSGFREE